MNVTGSLRATLAQQLSEGGDTNPPKKFDKVGIHRRHLAGAKPFVGRSVITAGITTGFEQEGRLQSAVERTVTGLVSVIENNMAAASEDPFEAAGAKFKIKAGELKKEFLAQLQE